MVPLRSDRVESNASNWSVPQRPTHLVLQDTTLSSAPRRRVMSRTRIAARKRLENTVLCVAAIAVLGFLLISSLYSLWHASYIASANTFAPVITKRIVPGDTLWRFASRYGDPNAYILDRVETIARDNHLSSDAPLVPGQTLRIVVRNPVVVAEIARQHHPSRLASIQQ